MNLPSNASTTALNARTFRGAWTNPKNAAVARHSVTTKPKSTSKAIGTAANAPKLSGGKWKKNINKLKNKEMELFDELKSELLRRAHNANACVEQYKRALESTNMQELCEVIKDNFTWCCYNNVIDGGILEKYKDDFVHEDIFYNENVERGFLLATATVEANGNATVCACGNATVEANGLAAMPR